jgi:hypothetical protein
LSYDSGVVVELLLYGVFECRVSPLRTQAVETLKAVFWPLSDNDSKGSEQISEGEEVVAPLSIVIIVSSKNLVDVGGAASQ